MLAAGAIFGLSKLHLSPMRWGQNEAQAGAIQATMVDALPLPPRQRTLDTGVLTSETPSPAPLIPKEQTIPPPELNAIPIPRKKKPAKVEKKEQPPPPKHPQPTPPQPTKAATGETAGIRIAESTMQLKNGTASVTVDDKTFGARFAYYINQVNRIVAQQWHTYEVDPRTSNGRSVTVVFDIDRAGTPSNAHIYTSSGSPTLDSSALRAVQRVDGFGPLPAGNHITVEYKFNYKLQ